MKISTSILLILLIFLTFGCNEDMPRDEATFKTITNEFIPIFDDYLKIKMETQFQHNLVKQEELIIQHYTGREKYLKRTKGKWLKVNELLAEFVSRYPESKWADDASFCRANIFMFARFPYSIFEKERLETLKFFLQSTKDIKLENWTKDQFSSTYQALLQSTPEGDKISETIEIRNAFYNMLIAHYGMKKELDEANYWVGQMEKDKMPALLVSKAREMVELYRDN